MSRTPHHAVAPARRAARYGALLIVGVAVCCAVVPLDPAAVERWYATGVYPYLQRTITPLSNSVPFAMLDLLMLVIGAIVIWRAAGALRESRRTRRLTPLLRAAVHVVVWTAALYLVFLAIWGLNYRRIPLTQKLTLEEATPDTAAVAQLGEEAVRQLNRLHASAHAGGWQSELWRDEGMRVAFAAAEGSIGDRTRPTTPGRLKGTLLGSYFRWASVDGMVNPFGLEVLGNPDLLPWEVPFVTAHEWAHLAGYAHETEASFIGLLACLRGDRPAQYSGWLFIYWQAAGELPRNDAQRVGEGLDAGPRADIAAIVERLRRGQFPLLRRLSWRVYDQYLKANRVEEGVRAYSEVLTLILRARFDEGWVPVRRAAPSAR